MFMVCFGVFYIFVHNIQYVFTYSVALVDYNYISLTIEILNAIMYALIYLRVSLKFSHKQKVSPKLIHRVSQKKIFSP